MIDIAQGGQHAGLGVIEIVAMHQPVARVVGLEGHGHLGGVGRHMDGIAPGAQEAPTVDFHHLEGMAVEMHEMGHHGLVAEDDFNALPGGDFQRRVILGGDSVEAPDIA